MAASLADGLSSVIDTDKRKTAVPSSNLQRELELAFCHFVFNKKVLGVFHGLELEVVSRGVFQKHGVLLARSALEPKRWRDDPFDAASLKTFR